MQEADTKFADSEKAISAGNQVGGVKLARDAIDLVEALGDPDDTDVFQELVVNMFWKHKLYTQAEEIQKDRESNLKLISDGETKDTIRIRLEDHRKRRPNALYVPNRPQRLPPANQSLKAERSNHEPRTSRSASDAGNNSELQMPQLRPARDSAVIRRIEDPPRDIIRQLQRIKSFPISTPVNNVLISDGDVGLKRTNSMPQRPPQNAPAGTHQYGGEFHDLIGQPEQWFNDLARATLPFIRGPNKSFQRRRYTKVRVAILDTGVGAPEDDYLMQPFDSMIVKIASCLADKRTGTKEDLHGMNVMYQLSKVCPNAELYSYRIKREGVLEPDEEAVVAALKLAIKDEVDIVNMSFGWKHWKGAVHAALLDAQKAGILLFASVSNSGAYGSMEYPARDDAVFAVDAADAFGKPAYFNSSHNTHEKGMRYTAPGVDLPSVTKERIKGTSYASPILAGVAALFLEFAKQEPLVQTDILQFMKKKEGMQLLLRSIAVQTTADQFFLVMPWELFYDESGNCGGDGGPSSRRHRVAGVIVDTLVPQFGADIGGELFK